MSRFLQLHFLTFYPPSNVNRDDTGAPKTATVGGATRLRISSQALKRAWRTSSIFKETLKGHMAKRTRKIGKEVFEYLRNEKNIDEEKAKKVADDIVEICGTSDTEPSDTEPCQNKELVYLSSGELDKVKKLADDLCSGKEKPPKKPETNKNRSEYNKLREKFLSRVDTAVDMGLFGRMIAKMPSMNREAAAQVAHAITTHRAMVEDDYFTAIDDLKDPEADESGAGFLSEAGFGSGVFYLYLCINIGLLKKNLAENLGEEADDALINQTLAALIEAAATVTPSGKQNSFAAPVRAGYILAEKGDEQPRTLAGAFAKPVVGDDLMGTSIKRLEEFRADLAEVYGSAASDGFCEVFAKLPENYKGKRNSLKDLIKFCQL